MSKKSKVTPSMILRSNDVLQKRDVFKSSKQKIEMQCMMSTSSSSSEEVIVIEGV